MRLYRVVEKIFVDEEKIYKTFTTKFEAKNCFNELLGKIQRGFTVEKVEQIKDVNYIQLAKITFKCGMTSYIAVKEVENV